MFLCLQRDMPDMQSDCILKLNYFSNLNIIKCLFDYRHSLRCYDIHKLCNFLNYNYSVECVINIRKQKEAFLFSLFTK